MHFTWIKNLHKIEIVQDNLMLILTCEFYIYLQQVNLKC